MPLPDTPLVRPTKACPRCAKQVPDTAVFCRFCGSEVGLRPPPEPADWIDAVPVRSTGRPGCVGRVVVGLLLLAVVIGGVLLAVQASRP